MRKLIVLALLGSSLSAAADVVTLTFVDLAGATFSASAGGLAFGNAINIIATNNTNGKSVALSAIDSGSTGAATAFIAGPPLVADYTVGGADSVLAEAGGHVFLSGIMADSGRLEAEYPNRAGAFLSRFAVTFVDPALLVELDAGTSVAPEGSVSLTLAQTSFDGSTLHAVLGGGEYTIETEATVPETANLFLMGTGILMMAYMRRRWF